MWAAYQILKGPEDAAAALKARRKQQRVGQAQLAATQALSRFTITDAEPGVCWPVGLGTFLGVRRDDP